MTRPGKVELVRVADGDLAPGDLEKLLSSRHGTTIRQEDAGSAETCLRTPVTYPRCAPWGLVPAQVMRARHRYMTGVLAGVRLLPSASVLLGSAARGWPRALVLQGEADLLALDLGVHDLGLKVIGGELLEEDARALVLDHLVVLGRRLHERQLERGLAVGHRLRRDLEAALRHR